MQIFKVSGKDKYQLYIYIFGLFLRPETASSSAEELTLFLNPLILKMTVYNAASLSATGSRTHHFFKDLRALCNHRLFH